MKFVRIKLGGSTEVGKFPLQSECSIKIGISLVWDRVVKLPSSNETRQFQFELSNFEKISNFAQWFPTENV